MRLGREGREPHTDSTIGWISSAITHLTHREKKGKRGSQVTKKQPTTKEIQTPLAFQLQPEISQPFLIYRKGCWFQYSPFYWIPLPSIHIPLVSLTPRIRGKYRMSGQRTNPQPTLLSLAPAILVLSLACICLLHETQH